MAKTISRAFSAAITALLTGTCLVAGAASASAATYCGYGQVGFVTTSAPTIQCYPELTTSSPTITGTAMQGQTLKAVRGATWKSPSGKGLPAEGLPLDRYQWQRNGVDIAGATASSYTATSNDVGRSLTVIMLTPVITGGQQWSWASAPTKSVSALTVLNTVRPAVSGTAKVGQTLTANPGTWTPGTTLAYRWLAGGVAVSGATGSTLVLGPAQAGKAISVRVTGTKPGYLTTTRTSGATALVANGTLVGVAPTITGTARVGSTLTAVPGSWSPAPVNLSYQWYRSGVAITGGTVSTYKLTTADLGKTITVKTTARKTGYNVAAKTSSATVPVATNVLTAPRPVITGTAAVGQILTAKTGTWSPAGVTLTFQWRRNGSPISGATASTYKAVTADLGSALSIWVTGRKSGYLVKAVTSNPTAPVTK